MSQCRSPAEWQPEDAGFWAEQGRALAIRNLCISIGALVLAFAVWMVWSTIVVLLPGAGFTLSTDELFWLTAAPGLSGATSRLVYLAILPAFGGRAWTTLSTALLLVPAFGLGLALQHPGTPYWVLLALALLCGLGGGNFTLSMANIGTAFPQSRRGWALSMNAGLGHIGIAAVQFLVPLAITVPLFGDLAGEPLAWWDDGIMRPLWLQNAAFVWVPFIVAATAAAWFGMKDVPGARPSLKEQMGILRCRHTWVMCWLYIGTFGSFVGFSAALPLLVKTQFPSADPLGYVFLAPLVASLIAPLANGLADRVGGARLTLWCFIAITVANAGMLFLLTGRNEAVPLVPFFGCCLLFAMAAGIGNAATYQMVPVIVLTLRLRTHEQRGDFLHGSAGHLQVLTKAAREAATVLGLISAIAAYGAFYIPTLLGLSLSLSGEVIPALQMFLLFYLSCIWLTWRCYLRRDVDIRF
ncbi:MAG TPA: MFS transporter [Azospirillum sp.]|nr:MFS transporter [Azospirillum sp.]